MEYNRRGEKKWGEEDGDEDDGAVMMLSCLGHQPAKSKIKTEMKKKMKHKLEMKQKLEIKMEMNK